MSEAISDAMRESVLIAHGPGHVVMQECEICGALRWKSSTRPEPDAVTLEPRSPDDCGRCIPVARRAPDVFEWVLAVVAKHTRKP